MFRQYASVPFRKLTLMFAAACASMWWGGAARAQDSINSLRVQDATAKPRVTFAEVAPRESGILFVHDNARSAERHLPETVGAGGCFFDYDNDGWLDLYLVNSNSSDFYTPARPRRNALYRNNGDGTFADVTERAKVAGAGFGMGAAAGDYDRDGWLDLFVTAYGRNTLYRNRGDGTFEDVSAKAGVGAVGWFTCATWFDFDNDGDLDLFVSSFVRYSKDGNIFCGDNKIGRRYYCIPRVFEPTSSRLYRNKGDGTFADVSSESGIAGVQGKAFGAVATDVNNDGQMDLFVANDTLANLLFLNRGGGKFEEVGLAAGVAYGANGTPRSGMGVDATDYDADGWQDLFVANIDQELFSLYHNDKDSTFTDEPGEIGPATRQLSGWGLKFFDYDNDGDPDLLLANGHPDDMIEMQTSRTKFREPLLMFENTGGVFKNVSAASGAVFAKSFAARGLTAGDYDNDGDVDALVANNGGAPALLRNDGGNSNRWLGVQLVARDSSPGGVGAVIKWRASGVKRERLKTSGGSYLASHDPREILGVGDAKKIDSLEIRWSSGHVDKLTDVPTNRYIKIVEGANPARPSLPPDDDVPSKPGT